MAEPQQKKVRRPQVILDEVVRAYTAAGWNVQISPPRAPTSFTAIRGDNFHHVKVVETERSKNDADPADIAKSDFVQNALSNKARPVYAIYTEIPPTKAGAPVKVKINFRDVNTGGSVRINLTVKKEN